MGKKNVKEMKCLQGADHFFDKRRIDEKIGSGECFGTRTNLLFIKIQGNTLRIRLWLIKLAQ